MKKEFLWILMPLMLLIVLTWIYSPISKISFSDTNVTPSKQEFISQFKFGQDIPVNMSYIEPFDENVPEEFQLMEATELVDTMIVNTRSGDTYIIKALTFPDRGIKPGDFHCVEIYMGERKIFEMKRFQGWSYLPERMARGRKNSAICCPFNVLDDTIVLLLYGTELMDQFPQLPIVVMKEGEARLVFNKPYKFIGMSFGTESETHRMGITKTIESAELFLQESNTKYDNEGNLIEKPIYRKLQIVEEGIRFGLD